MRIHKRTKQALSLIIGTLITVFAFALLLVTIVGINMNTPLQIVGDTPLVEPSQSYTQPVEIIPQPSVTNNQEEPAVEPPTPPSAVIDNDSAKLEMNPPMPVNIKTVLIIIGLTVLAAAIIAGVALLIRNLARNRLYKYGDADYEQEASHGKPQNIYDAKAQDVREIEDDDIYYREDRGYCLITSQIKSRPDADTGMRSPASGAEIEPTAETRADIPSSSRSDSLEYYDTGESDMDYVDIPRLFAK